MMIDPANQTATVAAIESVLGSDAIVRDPDSLAGFGASTDRPTAVVLPKTIDQLASVLSVALEKRALVQSLRNVSAVSRRKAFPGAIVINLERMNKILEVNSDLAYCLVEAGVTYSQLADYLRDKGHKLWLDVPGAPSDSIAGSFIERHCGYTPYSDHQLFQCGLEVMLADGRIVRTGMGAMPHSRCWQLFKYGYGPWVDGLFIQSHYAVVTKIGMWLMPQPPGYRPFMVCVPREGDLELLMNVLGPLKTNMVVPNGVAIANALHEAALLGRQRRDFGGQGPMAASAVADAAKSLGIGYWNLYGSIYGLPENVEIIWQIVREVFSSISGVQIFTRNDRSGDRLWSWREGTMRGAVASAPAAASSWTGGAALSVYPMSPVDGQEAMKLYNISRDVLARHGFDYVSEANAVWRAAHHKQFILPSAGESSARATDCAGELIAAQAAAGFGQIAADPELTSTAMATYEASGGALKRLQDLLKTALDPNGLLAGVPHQ